MLLGDDGPEHLVGAAVGRGDLDRPVGLIDLIGSQAILPIGADGAIAEGVVEQAHRAVQVTATYGGTNEVFRTIIAQQHLGLPRPDYPGRKVFLQGRDTAAA